MQPRLWRPALLCAFGEDGEFWTGPHHCALCAAAVEAACRAFDAAVARGEYNARGYTPQEWKRHEHAHRQEDRGTVVVR
jgi:hypothetical protein